MAPRRLYRVNLGILQRRRLGPELQTARIRSARIHNQGENTWLSQEKGESTIRQNENQTGNIDVCRREILVNDYNSKSFAMPGQIQRINTRSRLLPTP